MKVKEYILELLRIDPDLEILGIVQNIQDWPRSNGLKKTLILEWEHTEFLMEIIDLVQTDKKYPANSYDPTDYRLYLEMLAELIKEKDDRIEELEDEVSGLENHQMETSES